MLTSHEWVIKIWWKFHSQKHAWICPGVPITLWCNLNKHFIVIIIIIDFPFSIEWWVRLCWQRKVLIVRFILGLIPQSIVCTCSILLPTGLTCVCLQRVLKYPITSMTKQLTGFQALIKNSCLNHWPWIIFTNHYTLITSGKTAQR